MYTFKKFKHLDNNYMLVELNDKVKNNFLSSFLIGIDNKFLKLDTGDLNESTDYYKNKLNDKVMEKFDGKKFNKLNKKHLTYLADLCKMNLVIFDLNKLNLKFSTELNKKNKTVYMFKHGKKEYLLMKQNMRGMVSKLPVGIYEQFGGVFNFRIFNQNNPPKQPTTSQPNTGRTVMETTRSTGNSIGDINLIEQINLVRLADTIYELNQIEIENKINFIVSLIYKYIPDEISDKIDNEIKEQRKNLENIILRGIEDYIIRTDLNIKELVNDNKEVIISKIESIMKNINPNYTISEPKPEYKPEPIPEPVSVIGGENKIKQEGGINPKQDRPPYNRYEKSDYVHDFEQLRGNKKLHDLFKNTSMDKRVRTTYGGMAKRKREDPNSTYNKILNEMNNNEIDQNEDDIVDSLGLPFLTQETVDTQLYNNGKMYSTEIISLDAYEDIKFLSIDKKIEEIFEEGTMNPKKNFIELIDKCKEIYGLIKENKCDYLQFDQGDTKKLLLDTPISPNSTIGLTRLRNLPTLIDGAGSSKIDTIIENKNNTNNTNAEYWTTIYNSIFHENNSLPLTFSNVDYNKIGNGSDGFKINNIPINNGFTVDNLKEVMCDITGVINLQQDNDIKKLVNIVDDDKLQILRKLKFIGDRGQIVSAMNDNNNNFTSRTLLGSGDRIFIAYALEQQEPIIFSNQFITRLYVPDILPDRDQLKIIEQNLLNANTSSTYNNQKEYADAIFKAFLKEKFKEIQQKITLSPIQITITNEEIKELILSTFINFINNPDIKFKLLKDEILNLDINDGDSFSINNTDFINTNNGRIMRDNKDYIIKDIIVNIIQKIKTGRPVKKLYKKIKELLSTYIRKIASQRNTSKPSSDEEYIAYKIQLISDKDIILEYENKINEELRAIIKNNIKSLFDFKEKATESIEIIKSYKEEVKNTLGENASRIMNETELLKYIQENQ